MKSRLWGGLFLGGIAASVFAQGVPTPAPAAGAAREAASAAPQTETVTVPGVAGIQDQNAVRRGGVAAPGAKRPMDIRLRDGGVKMPECAQESREGVACK